MIEDFLQEFNLCDKDNSCLHLNNNGICCLDCLQILTSCDGTTFKESKNYLPRKITGHVIKPEDINNLNIPSEVLNYASELFDCMNYKIFRGANRRAIICACLLHSYKIYNYNISFSEIVKKFNTKQSMCLNGLKLIDLHLGKNSKLQYKKLSNNNITISFAIKNIASKLNINQEINYDNYIDRVNSRCRITTAAAAILWLWIRDNNLEIKIEQVSKQGNLSVNTIKKAIKLTNDK